MMRIVAQPSRCMADMPPGHFEAVAEYVIMPDPSELGENMLRIFLHKEGCDCERHVIEPEGAQQVLGSTLGSSTHDA